MSDTTVNDRYPANRYPTADGSPHRGRRWILAALSVAVGALLAFVVYQRFGSSEIESEVIAFEVIDDSTVDLQFKVTREDPSREAVCVVRARSKDGQETGRREVLIPPSDSGTVVLNSTVKTSQRPGTGDIYGCSFVIPEYLRAP
jgi:hypothetical protein